MTSNPSSGLTKRPHLSKLKNSVYSLPHGLKVHTSPRGASRSTTRWIRKQEAERDSPIDVETTQQWPNVCGGEGGAGADRGRDRGERVDMNEREWGRGRREENGGGQTQQREGGAIFGGEG